MTNTAKSSPTDLVRFKTELNKYEKNISNLLQQAKITPLQFMTVVSNSMQENPKLFECEQNSVIGAVLASAELGLLPTKMQGESYLIPYYDKKSGIYKAQLQIGYQGFQTLMYRSGIKGLWAEIVRENDEFFHELGTEPKLTHRPAMKNRGEPIGAYAVAVINGHKIFKFMMMEDIMKIKNIAQAGDSNFSPWNSKNDPELWMWKKTCIKQVAKTMPKSDNLAQAVYVDNVGETGGYIQVNEKREVEILESDVFDQAKSAEPEKLEPPKKPYETFEDDKDVFKKKLESGKTGKEIYELISKKFEVDAKTKKKIESMTLENFESLFSKPDKKSS